MPAGLPLIDVRRHLGPAEHAAVRELLDVAAAQLDHVPMNDAAETAFAAGGGPGFLAILLRARPLGPLTGYAQLSREPDGGWLAAVVVHPRLGRDRATVGTDLLGRLLREAAASASGPVTMWIAKPDADADTMAAACGLRADRDVHQLRRSLPVPASGPALPVRSFVPGQDEDAWLALNARAFAGHPDQGSWDRGTLANRTAEPWFDPADVLLHERDGRLAASCWTKVHAEERPPAGEIYVIGVDPDLHGQGLGRAMTLAGLDHLARRGLTRALLYVDAANAAALGLYDSLGFRDDHVDRAYVGRLPSSRPA